MAGRTSGARLGDRAESTPFLHGTGMDSRGRTEGLSRSRGSPAAGATRGRIGAESGRLSQYSRRRLLQARQIDRKSTRLNSSHTVISYAVFCLKKKKKV